MAKKKPIIVEVIGNPEVGKTDFCSKIPNSAMIDLTVWGESDIIFEKNRSAEEVDTLYIHAESLNTIVRFIRDLPPEITTVCFDGSSNLMGLIEADWCQEKGRKSALQLEYGELYERLNDKIIKSLKDRPCNIVFTSGLKDEYIGTIDEKGRTSSVKTGKKLSQGIKPMEYIRDVGLNLYYDDEGMRANRILKNRFVSKTLLKDEKQILNPKYVKVLQPEATWQSLIDAITVEGSAMKKEWIV